MPCSECKNKVSPTKKVACSLCGIYFHRNCAPTSFSDHTDTSNWKCESCEKDLIIKKNKTKRKIESNKTNIINEKEDNYLILIRNDIAVLSNTNIELKKSISFCGGKLDEYGKKVDDLLTKTKSLENKINDMGNKYMNLEME